MDIYNFINTNIKLETNPLFFYFSFNKEEKGKIDESDCCLFELFEKITQIIIGIDKNNGYITKFSTIWVPANGKPTFRVEDITENDINLLEQIDLKQLPLNLRAFFAHIVWERENKKHYEYVLTAIDSYIDLFKEYIKNEKEYIGIVDTINLIIFALNLSKSIGKKEKIKECLDLINKLATDTNTKDALVLELLPILGLNNFGDIDSINKRLDKINTTDTDIDYQIKVLQSKVIFFEQLKSDDFARIAVNQLINLLQKYYESLKDTDKVLAVNILNYIIYLQRKYKVTFVNSADLVKEIHRLEKSIKEEARVKSIAIKDPKLASSLDTIFNISKKLTFEEYLIALTYFIKFYEVNNIKNEIIKNPTLCDVLMGQKIFDNNGMIVDVLPPLDFNNLDDNILNKHINRRIMLKQSFIGSLINLFMEKIGKKYSQVKIEDLEFLSEENNIIPNGRKEIIESGLYWFFNGLIYESLHILIPQFENMLRYLLEFNGINNMCIDDKQAEKVIVLSSVLDALKENKVLKENIVFNLRSLFDEASGANFRNRICHGITDAEEGVGPIAVYVVCMILKFFVDNSKKCQDIAKNSMTLHILKSII